MDDNSVYQMLKLVNTAEMEEIELYLQLVRVKPQVNQSIGTYTDLLRGGNFNVKELDYGCGLSSSLVVVTDKCEVNEDDQDCEDGVVDEDGDIQANVHVLSFLTIINLWRMSKGDISLWMCQVVMFQITQILRTLIMRT